MNSPAPLRVVLSLCAAACALGGVKNARGETYVVDSIATLQAKISQAVPGDVITVKNGSYTTSSSISVRCRGTAEAPVTITAESVGGVEIQGTNGFSISAPATHLSISGFVLTHASGKNTIGAGTSAIRISRCTYRCVGDGAYLTVSGDDAEVSYNEFDTKKSGGAMIAISGTGSQVAQRLWVHHNYFHDFSGDGSTGAEMLRFGLTTQRLSMGAGMVEHNLFVRCRGVNDLISNRSSGNTYRYNTFLDSPTSHVTIRQGNDCIISGNYFRNTEGIRLYGDRLKIISNYLEGNYVGINLGNGDADLRDTTDAPANSHDRPDDCVIAFNTLINNATHYQMSGRQTGALGATNTVFANNLLVGGTNAAKIEGPYTGATWTGNLIWQSQNPRDLPPNSFVEADPLLTSDAEGIKRIQSGSPAIAAAQGEFPLVSFDLDGQPRAEKKTVGADELSDKPAVAKFLTAKDVGPAAGETEPKASSVVSPTPASEIPATAPDSKPVP